MVDPDSHCGSVFFADLYKASKLFLRFFMVFVEITRIDSYFFHNRSYGYGGRG